MSLSSAERRSARAELQAWYLVSLHPKLVRAADTGIVPPAAAEALDRQMRAFLGGQERGRGRLPETPRGVGVQVMCRGRESR